MLQASPLKKKMQTSVPALFCTFCMTAVFLLSLLICGIRVMGEPAEIQAVCEHGKYGFYHQDKAAEDPQLKVRPCHRHDHSRHRQQFRF